MAEENEEKKIDKPLAHNDDNGTTISLEGMYQDWFLTYASYTIMDRAIPTLKDGLKPVQRRILHSMRELEDGRYNKVANIVGNTMKYHPHGDASIGDALVTLGQKDLLIDCQGNWGNILTGDGAAAPRYIEARLSKFALDVVFNPKITEWKPSYDGRNKEPITLPVKFPLLLAQGTEGIGMAFATKILPHNFNELIDASIAYLRDQPFELFPDFPTGGMIDVSRYNDGLRRIKGVNDIDADDDPYADLGDFDDFDDEEGGGKRKKNAPKDSANASRVRVRARIQQVDKKTLVITELPYTVTTLSLIDSIEEAKDKGRLKISKIDDNTAENAEIVLHLAQNVSPDQTIDALYKFTLCEIPLSPNSFVIYNDRPVFMSISEMLRKSTDYTVDLLSWELRILIDELESSWHWISLEKLFFEKGIYKELEKKNYDTWDDQLTGIERRFDDYRNLLKREITREDVEKLCEKPVRKISKFDIKKADEQLAEIEKRLEEARYNLDHIVDYTIDYFKRIKEKYGKGRERKTEIRNFENIEAVTVTVANQKLCVNKKEGFAGYDLKKDENVEYVCDCSDIDDIIAFRKDGTFVVSKVQSKGFLGTAECKELIYVSVFRRNDERTIYNMVYSDGPFGNVMVKRFSVTGITRDKNYDLTKGTKGTKVLYFSANPNGEAEVITVHHKAKPKLKKIRFDFDFAEIAIKGRAAAGNILTRNAVQKITVKGEGVSTLGARQIWYDESIKRLNVEGRGTLLGDFKGTDRILSITRSGYFRTCNFDLSNHFDDDMIAIRKFNPNTIITAVYQDGENKNFYIKRFKVEDLDKKLPFIDESTEDSLIDFAFDTFPRLEVVYDTENSNKKIPSEIIEVTDFIGVKGYKAKGKRITTSIVEKFTWLDPLPEPEPEPEPEHAPSDDAPSPDELNPEFDPDADVIQGTLF